MPAQSSKVMLEGRCQGETSGVQTTRIPNNDACNYAKSGGKPCYAHADFNVS